ncbi:MAG: RHS repeat domain-containing protein [Candidatus Faecivicinus sp.]
MKGKRWLSFILVLVLLLQCIPAGLAEYEAVVEPAEETYFVTEPVPLNSLDMAGLSVIVDGERTGEALPEGAVYEDGVLTLDSVDLPGGIWTDGDLKIVVRGSCTVEHFVDVYNGTLRIVGEDDGRIELESLASRSGSIELTDVEVVIPVDSHPDEAWDGVWASGNITAVNSRILLPDSVGFFSEFGTMTFENTEINCSRLMVHETAPVGGIHFTGCEVSAHQPEMSLFSYAGPLTVTDSTLHTGSVWARNGLTAVNSTFEDSHSQWYICEGDLTMENCEVNSIGGIDIERGHNATIEDSRIELRIEDSSFCSDLRAENVIIRRSQVEIVSYSNCITAQESLLIENCDMNLEVICEDDVVDLNEYDSAIDIVGNGMSEIVGSRIAAKGEWSGIRAEDGVLNVIASDIRAEGGVSGVFADRGTVLFTGGTLNAEGGVNGVSAESGALEFNAVNASLKGGYCAVIANTRNPDAVPVAFNGCDASAELVSFPDGANNYGFPADDCADAQVLRLREDGRLTAENAVSELTLTPNGELSSVFRASQSECVMGATASFVLSYFGADAGEVRIDLPEELTLLEGSVTVNGETRPGAMDGPTLCVKDVLPGEAVRFTVSCVSAGEFEIAASAAGEALDSLALQVRDFSLGLPSAAASTELYVSGVAVPGSKITFYDGSERAGMAESNLAGDWAAKLTISDAVGEHAIRAKIETPDGGVIEPAPEIVVYDPETVEVLRLVMTNTIHGEKIDDLITCETVLDFATASVEAPFYSFFPEYPTITFSAELSANAAPEKVGSVYAHTFDSRGEETLVELTYNAFTGTWVGTQDYSEYTIPEEVCVSYTGSDSGSIQVGDGYVSYSIDANGGMTIGEDENAIRIVQRNNAIDILDMDGNGLRLLMVNGNNMILSTIDGETLATVTTTDDGATLESADKSIAMILSEDSLSISDVISGCTLFADESRTEMNVPDGGGNVTRYLSENASGGKIEYPDGTFEQWQYAEDGLSAAYTARDGSEITYTYDAEGSLTRVDGALTVEYGENEIRYTDADGETLVELDGSGNITRIIYHDGLAVGYAYDESGNLVSITDPMGDSTHYAYDANGNIVSVSDDNGVVAEYAYDEKGSLIGRTLANGAHTEYVYDEAALTSTLRNLLPDGSVQSEHTTAFNESGMAVAQSGSHGEWTFTYDQDGQLLSMTGADGASTTYEYTPSGTIAAKTDADGRVEYASNALNQITQMGDTVYEYDLNGNLIRETGPGGETAYVWDDFGRLVKVTGADGSTCEYGYDAFGNRSTVTVNGETTRYIWNPSELPEIIGAVLPDGSYVRYIQGNGLEAQVGEDGAVYYQYDQLGSTVALTGEDGQVLSSWTYSPVGEVVSAQETVTTPFGYVGRYGIMTDGSGLQYMRARYVHEGLSAFISPDPAGQLYDVNVYRYAGNNRAQCVDMTGAVSTALVMPGDSGGNGRAGIPGNSNLQTNPLTDPRYKPRNPINKLHGRPLYAKEALKLRLGNLKTSIAQTLLINGADYVLQYLFPGLDHQWWDDAVMAGIGALAIGADIALLLKLAALIPIMGVLQRVGLCLFALYIGWQIGSALTSILRRFFPDAFPDINPIEWLLNPPFIDDTPVVIYPEFPRYKTIRKVTRPTIDPSGYVYEGVSSARLEGVTATLYFKPTLETPDGQAAVWNAGDYSQINPLITDAEGKYAWMVNTGWYKVVYEKQGYETAESEWLPVPPVQTGVNISMTSYEAPEVVEAALTGERVRIAFDRFMSLENLQIAFDGVPYDGEIIPIEQENGLVRRIALWKERGGDAVYVEVSGAVSYAGVEMIPYEATIAALPDVRAVEAVSESSIGYGSLETVRFRVLDSWNQPLCGEELDVENLTGEAALLLTARVTTDGEGCAEVRLIGLKPAAAVLSVSGAAKLQLQVRNEDTSGGAYAEGLARDHQWRADLHAEWTNGIDESDELVEEYIGRFTAASEEIDAGVSLSFISEQLASWNQEVAELVKSWQNSLFTTEEILRLDEIIAQRALYASALLSE